MLLSFSIFLSTFALLSFGFYFLLSENNMKTMFGIMLAGHGANLLVLICGQYDSNIPPFIGATNTSNPLPQALILTAIVIGFAMSLIMFIIEKNNKKR